jgi:hypothetical protein
MNWIRKLQARWKVNSTLQVMLILLVFACTGVTVLLIKRPLFNYWFGDSPLPTTASIVYYILILPIYNIILLFYGFVLGQFKFFWAFEKRFFKRIISFFQPDKKL